MVQLKKWTTKYKECIKAEENVKYDSEKPFDFILASYVYLVILSDKNITKLIMRKGSKLI